MQSSRLTRTKLPLFIFHNAARLYAFHLCGIVSNLMLCCTSSHGGWLYTSHVYCNDDWLWLSGSNFVTSCKCNVQCLTVRQSFKPPRHMLSPQIEWTPFQFRFSNLQTVETLSWFAAKTAWFYLQLFTKYFGCSRLWFYCQRHWCANSECVTICVNFRFFIYFS